MKNASVILGVIRLRQSGESYRTIEKRYQIGSSAAQRIIRRYNEIGRPLKDLSIMQPQDIEKLFFPPENMARTGRKPMPDWAKIDEEWRGGGRDATLFNLWRDYKKEHPDGYEITQFRFHFWEYEKEHGNTHNVVMAENRVPGKEMFIDWVGERPEVMLDTKTGQLSRIHVFVTTVGVSDETYAESFPDEKLPRFLTGINHALEAYGAVTKFFVPDNLRTAVTRNTKDELILESLFEDLQDYYGVIVTPALPRSPHGKPTVEEAARVVETRVLYQIKKHIYTSYEELNQQIKEIVHEINCENFEHRAYSRQDLFEKYDKPCMKPLPGRPFAICEYRSVAHIPDNYHVEFDDHYYSVPYRMLGKPCIVKATASEIRICDLYNRLICRHARSYEAYPRYITDDDHMPPNHRYETEVKKRTGADYRKWAASYGPNMTAFIDAVLKKPRHEEQAYRSCMGILQKGKEIPAEQMERIAGECIAMNSCRYSTFRDLVNDYRARSKNGEQPSEDNASVNQQTPRHNNIRGPHYYR